VDAKLGERTATDRPVSEAHDSTQKIVARRLILSNRQRGRFPFQRILTLGLCHAPDDLDVAKSGVQV